MQYHIFPADKGCFFAGNLNLNGGGNLKPSLTGNHTGSHIRRAYAGGERTQCTISTGVAVCADHAVTAGHNPLLRQQRVLNPHIAHIKIVGNAVGTGKSTHLLAVLRGLDVLVGRKVIHYKGNAGLVKHAVLAKFVHLIDGNRRGHIVAKYHIQLGLNQLTGYYMIQTGVRRQDLLRHCHSHDRHRP